MHRGPRARQKAHARGFTLIEILIVVTIVSMVMAIGLPAVSRVTYQRLNSTTRKFTGMIKTIRNDAILLSTTHRLAFDLEKQTFWVESQRTQDLLLDPLTELELRRKQKKNDDPPPSAFEPAEKYGKGKDRPMPSGVQVLGVLKAQEGFRSDGVVYIHFFPNGFNEQAIVQLVRTGDKDSGYSLVIRPSSSQVEIVRGLISSFDAVTL